MTAFKLTYAAFAVSLVFIAPANSSEPVANISAIIKQADHAFITTANNLYKQAIQQDSIETTFQLLDAQTKDKQLPQAKRAQAMMLKADLAWRHGMQDTALQAAREATKLDSSADTLLLLARLLDSKGDTKAALSYYQQADVLATAAQKEFIQLRLSLLNSHDNITPLTTLAKQQDPAFSNRAAVVLALTGHPDEALSLYQPEQEKDKPYVSYLRQAEWALQAKDYPKAQAYAWQASQNTDTQYNLRYALSLLTESYRKAGQFEQVISLLTPVMEQKTEYQEVVIDVLTELQRFNDAIALFQQTKHQLTPELRNRLLTLYQFANRTDDLVKEYHSRIAAEPNSLVWYQGLASYYLTIDDTENARRVWQQFIAQPALPISTRLDGAEAMLRMGFFDDAITAVEKQLLQHEYAVTASFFLFETFLKAGQPERAEAILQQLEQQLPPSAAERKDIADGYERLYKHAEALRIYEQLAQQPDGLGYDEKLRLAWLYSVTDNKATALQYYQSLWTDSDNPARRSFIEAQFLLLAAQLNQLGDIAVALEEKLNTGNASENDLNLLVRIYVEANDVGSAVDVIEEYARHNQRSESELLQQLSKVYLILNDHQGYDQVLRKLIIAEPEFRDLHIRNLINNLLANPQLKDKEARIAEFEYWVAELKANHPEAVSGEFEANLMSKAGFPEKAIESYRKALVQTPDQTDNLLLLADLLQTQRRTPEAITLLQHAAERAESDNEFVIAIDGLINMIGRRTANETLNPQAIRIFNWTQRIILERIASRQNQYYLYSLLADIAEETGDQDAQFRAIENSLPNADIRRVSVLRELIMLTSGGINAHSSGQTQDVTRKLTYGRRLVALKQELPPDIYIELGNTLLEAGELLAAEQTFSLISDVTDTLDLDVIKGEAFSRHGYITQALQSYSAALNRSRQDLSLLADNALLREQNQQDKLAQQYYWQALQLLLQQQSVELHNRVGTNTSSFRINTDPTVTRSFRQHYTSLLQGFLTTWPAEPAAQQQLTGQIIAMLKTSISEVKALQHNSTAISLIQYPKLNHMLNFARQVALSQGNRGMMEQIDSNVLEQLNTDQHFNNQLVAFYRQFGISMLRNSTSNGPLVTELNPSPLHKGFTKAVADEHPITAARYAAALEDEQLLTNMFIGLLEKGNVYQAISSGMSLLSKEQFRRIIGPRLYDIENIKTELFHIAYGNARLFLRAEHMLERQLLTDDEILAQALAYNPSANRIRLQSGGDLRFGDFLLQRLGTDNFLRYAQHLFNSGNNNSVEGLSLFSNVLRTSLTTTQRQQVKTAVEGYINRTNIQETQLLHLIFTNLFILDAAKDNQSLIIELIKFFATKAQWKIDLTNIMQLYFSGQTTAALQTMLSDPAYKPLLQEYFAKYTFRRYFSAEIKQLEDMIKAGRLTDTTTVYNLMLLMDNAVNPELFLSLLPQEKQLYQRNLLRLYQNNDLHKFEAELKAYLARFDDEMLALPLLGEFYKSQGRFTDWQALQENDDDNLLSPASLRKLAQDLERLPPQTSSLQPLFSEIRRQATAQITPALDANAQRGNLLLTRYPEVSKLLRAVSTENVSQLQPLLRSVWRSGSQTTGNNNARSVYNLLMTQHTGTAESTGSYQQNMIRGNRSPSHRAIADFIRQQQTVSDAPLLLEKLSQYPFFSYEMDKLLAATSTEQLNSSAQSSYYFYLAKAYQQQGALPARLSELQSTLQTGSISVHEFNLYLSLRSLPETTGHQPEALSKAERQAILHRLAHTADISAYQNLQLARLWAASGDYQRAITFYQAIALSLIPVEQGPVNFLNQDYMITYKALFSEMSAVLPVEEVSRLIGEILRQLQTEDLPTATNAYLMAFATDTAITLAGAKDAPALTSQWLPALQHMPYTDGTSIKFVYDAIQQRETGQYADAWKTLTPLLSKQTAQIDRREATQYRQPTLPVSELLGIPGTRADMPMLVSGFDALFLHTAKLLPADKSDWLNFVADATLAGMTDSRFEQTKLNDFMLALLIQLHQNDKTTAQQWFSRYVQQLQQYTETSQTYWELLLKTALRSGLQLPESAYDYLHKQQLLSGETELTVLQLVQMLPPEKAFVTARKLFSTSSRYPVQIALQQMATQAGDHSFSREVQKRIKQQQDVMQQLRQ